MNVDDAALADRLTGILSDLIAIPSAYPPGDSTKICAYAAERMRAAGYETEVLARTDGVDNVVASLGQGGPALVFNAHVDTVGIDEAAKWDSDPFRAAVRDGRIHGLGAGNCKGSMATQIWLAEEIARRGGPKSGTLVFTFVGDEERLGEDGLSYLREIGKVKPDMLVLGAQTSNQLITEERGVIWARIDTGGRSAHAGNPATGDSAILRMVRVINRIEAELAPRLAARVAGDKQATMNIGLIRGGHNTNAVPSSCTVEIDCRLLPDTRVEDAFAELKDIVASAGEPAGSVEVTFLTGTNGFTAPADGPAVTALNQAIETRLGAPARFLNAVGVSDGRYFADDGIEIINFGPGSGDEGHAANESVPISELVDAARIQLDFIERLLGVD